MNKLWTRDFTIITLGSVVDMIGFSLSGFAMSLMVLDYTASTLLYAIFIVAFTLPQIIMPVFSGAILDRFSRKKTIYTIDFISGGLFLVVATIFQLGLFNVPIFLLYSFITGSLNSIYMVAYDSFYPLLISEGNYQKAYSIASVLETLSAVMIPVSALLYNTIGISLLLYITAVCFLLAAIIETKIQHKEEYIELQKKSIEGQNVSHFRRMIMDTKEGFRYLKFEKGLLAVSLYFMFSFFANGASSVITLPYFKGNYENGEYIYILVWGMNVIGRAICGLIHYKIKLPAKIRYALALSVYIFIGLTEAFYLYLPIPLMMILCFLSGVGGVTSYTIRVSATQSYVPDEKKGRFNGAFNMMTTVGNLGGELVAGALALVIPQRNVITIMLLISIIAAIVIIGGNKKHVAPLYNRQQ